MNADVLLGTDLSVVPTFVAHDAAEVDLVRKTRAPASRGALPLSDFATLTGRQNLAQALILRMLTPRGSLARLGHAGYGSRLHELVGERKTEILRNLCRAFVLDVVAQEPRVEPKAVALTFDPAAESSSSFVFTVAVQPRGDLAALSVGLEVGL